MSGDADLKSGVSATSVLRRVEHRPADAIGHLNAIQRSCSGGVAAAENVNSSPSNTVGSGRDDEVSSIQFEPSRS
jgi:hypothetical protein